MTETEKLLAQWDEINKTRQDKIDAIDAKIKEINDQIIETLTF
jgi:hypothetical protein